MFEIFEFLNSEKKILKLKFLVREFNIEFIN